LAHSPTHIFTWVNAPHRLDPNPGRPDVGRPPWNGATTLLVGQRSPDSVRPWTWTEEGASEPKLIDARRLLFAVTSVQLRCCRSTSRAGGGPLVIAIADDRGRRAGNRGQKGSVLVTVRLAAVTRPGHTGRRGGITPLLDVRILG